MTKKIRTSTQLGYLKKVQEFPKLVCKIDEGGNGKVFKAIYPSGDEVAVKVINGSDE